MKPFLLLVLSLIILSSFFSYKNHLPKAKQIEKVFIPINEKLLVCKYEVSNGEYKQFMDFLISTKQEVYRKCLLDTMQQFRRLTNESHKVNYHSHPNFKTYPVVTVSYEGANEYCNWLTKQYNSDKDRKYKKVVFRLPTEAEWMQAASGGNKNKMYPWGNFYLRNSKGEFLCNFLRLGDQSIFYDDKSKTYKVAETFIESANQNAQTTPVNEFPANPDGFYNLSGNAAEMVAKIGLAKGGSFNDPGQNVTISSKKYYNGPSLEIGFRVLMEIIDK